MKRYPGMNVTRGVLLATALLVAACGGRERSVAEKSAATTTGGMDHSAHGATSTGTAVDHSTMEHSTMDHSAHGAGASAHAGMNHGATAGGTTDHSGHAAARSVDHAAMGHGTAATNAHAGHGTASATRDAHDGHATTPATRDAHAGHSAAPAAGNAHAQHQAPTASADHSQHGSTRTAAPAAANAHAQHGAAATTTTPTIAPAPRSNTDIQRVQPAATLRSDAFDAPAAVSVSEAAKAAQAGGHDGHQTRGITPGQDRENPPTPMPATRDGSTSTKPATDHSQHGAQSAAAVYSCPMHPEVTSSQPDNCPRCGMALVKKK